MRLAARIAVLAAAAALALVVAAPASADDLVRPTRLDQPPPGYRMTGDQATAVADRVPKIVRERRKHPGSFSNVFEKSGSRWQVSYYSRGKGSKEIAQVY